jgi:hypothetical protein
MENRPTILETLTAPVVLMNDDELEAHHARILEIQKKDIGQIMEDEARGHPDYMGFLYVLSNPSMPGILKIGITSGLVEKRVAELSRPTSVPEPFKVECYFPIYENLKSAESKVHRMLDEFRTSSNREFFRVPLDQVEQCIESLLGQKPRRLEVECDGKYLENWLNRLP